MTTKPGNVLALEINTTSSANLLKNHSGYFGKWGWVMTGGAGGGPLFGDMVLGFGGVATGKMTTSDYLPVTAGQYVGLKVFARTYGSARGFTAKAYFYNASNVQVGSALTLISAFAAPAGSVQSATPALAPATATKFKLEFESVGGVGTAPVGLSQAMLTTAATSGGANQNFPADVWVNILGTALTITTESGNKLDGVQDILTPGFLTATITDPALDPATSSSLKKGRQIRLQATASGTKPVWQGVIDTADTEYEDNKKGPVQRRITITAVDAARSLDNSPLATTVTGGFAGQVSAAAAAARLPTSDGSTTPAAGTGVEAEDASATSTDWIRRACNTYGGYVWIDQLGVIQQRLAAALATSPAYTFSDNSADTGALFYTKIGLNFGSRSLVNALNISRYNVDEIEGDFKTYGPYVAEASEYDNGGRVTDDIEITAGSPSALAASILPVFATPKRFPREVRVDAMDDLAKVLSVNKYDPVRVKRLALFNDVVRVISIRHEITSTSWATYFAMRPLESATAVVVTNPTAGADTGPGDLDTGAGTGFPRLGRRYRDTNQGAITINTWTTLQFDKIDASDGMGDATATPATYDAATHEYIIRRAGRYHVSVQSRIDSAASAFREVAIVKNGTRVGKSFVLTATSGLPSISTVLKLAVGDRVRFDTIVNVASSTIVSSAEREIFSSVAYIGP